MYRQIKLLLAAIATTLSLCGCMQHNGNIGDWFGTWKLQSITIDGAESSDYQGNIFFQFQTNIVRISRVEAEGPATYKDCFGRWEELDNNTLILDFSYTADGMDGNFNPMPETMLVHNQNLLTITEQTSKKMQWVMHTQDQEKTIVYSLRKQ